MSVLDDIFRFWDVSDWTEREVYLMVIDGDNDALKKGGFAWIGIDAIYQFE